VPVRFACEAKHLDAAEDEKDDRSQGKQHRERIA
jgi:hypothetical protein